MMDNNVLLVNPWICDFTAFDFWLKPLGLLYVAGTLQKHGYNITLLDCMYRHDSDLQSIMNVKDEKYGTGHFYYEIIEKPSVFNDIPRFYKRYGMPIELFQDKLNKIPKPDVIGITSAMTYWYPGVFKVIEILKETFRDVPLVLGGIYATLCYDHAVKNSGADYVISGTGELEMLKLCDKICNIQRDYSEFNGSIDEAPYPAYNLYPELSSVSVIASLGCPLRCTYCASFNLQPKFKYRNAQKFIYEIENYARRGIQNIAFYDDALLWKHQRFIDEILSSLLKKQLPITFHTPNGIHAKEVDIELAIKLYQSNFKTLNIALETINANRQKTASSGKVTNEEFEKCIKNLKQVGYTYDNITAYVMIGLPNQEIDEIIDTYVFVYNLGIRLYVSQFSPVPGTPDFNKAIELYGFNPDEPLYSNKTAFPFRNRLMPYELYEKVRHFAKYLNRNIERGLNVKSEARKIGILH